LPVIVADVVTAGRDDVVLVDVNTVVAVELRSVIMSIITIVSYSSNKAHT